MRTLTLALGACGLALAAALQAQADLTRTESDSMARKISAILEAATHLPNAGHETRTTFSEREVNAFLKFNNGVVPTGILEPRLIIGDAARIEATAIVDLDAIRKSKERGWLDPMNLMFGSMELHAAGKLYAANGKGVFQYESASLGGIPIPKTVLQELVYYYSRTPDLPQGVDLNKPFDLPQGIRQVEIKRGGATIIQ